MTSIINIKKSSSELSLSSLDSYQSISDSEIECCICNEIVNNDDSYMPDCKHSWCKECNHSLNKNFINNCPICKNKFKSKLKNGRWKLKSNYYGMNYWEWEKGEEDSKKLLRIRKIQTIFKNFYAPINYNFSLSGISI